jgi:hypothetical protein
VLVGEICAGQNKVGRAHSSAGSTTEPKGMTFHEQENAMSI